MLGGEGARDRLLAPARGGLRRAPALDDGSIARTFRLLDSAKKVAAVGAVLLAVSTFGPVLFVELAEILPAAEHAGAAAGARARQDASACRSGTGR